MSHMIDKQEVRAQIIAYLKSKSFHLTEYGNYSFTARLENEKGYLLTLIYGRAIIGGQVELDGLTRSLFDSYSLSKLEDLVLLLENSTFLRSTFTQIFAGKLEGQRQHYSKHP